jgi:hypothetical protein
MSYASIPPYVFMECCLIIYKQDRLYFNFYLFALVFPYGIFPNMISQRTLNIGL